MKTYSLIFILIFTFSAKCQKYFNNFIDIYSIQYLFFDGHGYSETIFKIDSNFYHDSSFDIWVCNNNLDDSIIKNLIKCDDEIGKLKHLISNNYKKHHKSINILVDTNSILLIRHYTLFCNIIFYKCEQFNLKSAYLKYLKTDYVGAIYNIKRNSFKYVDIINVKDLYMILKCNAPLFKY